MAKETVKRITVAASLSAEMYSAMEDLCVDLRIRRNSEFLREAIAEKLERHGRVVPDATTED